ncbi:hypothetical protein Cni_G13023 [Canna indica]|uniref:Uncharacterized protein n=1 Tax=Canna indica TaxID=4628 RepID=A0AAQ3K9I9_9LILI|nr:hypothetical protein Cni_G13023 [Canna indica]
MERAKQIGRRKRDEDGAMHAEADGDEERHDNGVARVVVVALAAYPRGRPQAHHAVRHAEEHGDDDDAITGEDDRGGGGESSAVVDVSWRGVLQERGSGGLHRVCEEVGGDSKDELCWLDGFVDKLTACMGSTVCAGFDVRR